MTLKATNPRALLIVGATLVALLALSGCRAPWVAAATASPTPDLHAAALKYAQCMRDHGITNFPDPQGNGGIAIDAGSLGLDPRSQAFKDADAACEKYLSQVGSRLAPNPAAQADALKFAQCMRSHGVSNFPDPPSNPGTGPVTNENPGSGPGSGSIVSIDGQTFDPNDPTFKAAFDACKSILGSKVPQTSTGGAPGK
jgi:hypothetical protein